MIKYVDLTIKRYEPGLLEPEVPPKIRQFAEQNRDATMSEHPRERDWRYNAGVFTVRCGPFNSSRRCAALAITNPQGLTVCVLNRLFLGERFGSKSRTADAVIPGMHALLDENNKKHADAVARAQAIFMQSWTALELLAACAE